MKKVYEDGEGVGAPTNSVGTGAIAGTGGPGGEPVPSAQRLGHGLQPIPDQVADHREVPGE